MSTGFFYLSKLPIKSKQVNRKTPFLFEKIEKLLGIFLKIMKMLSHRKFKLGQKLKESLPQMSQNPSPFLNVFLIEVKTYR